MMDMSGAIQPKSDQINADDLIGGPITVTIDSVNVDMTADQKVSMKLQGMQKVFRPCKSMARVMVTAWGPDASKYAGHSLTLYRDPKVKWGGMEVGGIRISHMSHIDAPLSMMLTQTRSQRAPFKVAVLQGKPDADPAPAAPDNAQDLARAAAAKGSEAFTAWWNSEEGKACRSAVKPIMDELKDTVAKAAPKDEDECPI